MRYIEAKRLFDLLSIGIILYLRKTAKYENKPLAINNYMQHRSKTNINFMLHKDSLSNKIS